MIEQNSPMLRLPYNASPAARLLARLLPLDDQPVELEELADDRLPLQHLQLPQALLHQLLYLAFLGNVLCIAEGVARSAFGVFSKVVGGELAGLAEEGAVLGGCALVVSLYRTIHFERKFRVCSRSLGPEITENVLTGLDVV
jgi:hypothetical protein